MRSDATFFQRFRVECILTGILIIVVICVLLHHFPITVSSEDAAGLAVMPQQLGQSDILLILPENNENAPAYSQLDFSFAWYNLLSQYAGPFTIALTGDIKEAADLQYRLIVIPQRSAESMTDAQIQIVSQAVQLGTTLIIEMPSPEWAPLTSIKSRSKESSSIKHFTDAPNSPLTGNWRDQLLNVPLDTQVMRLDALDSDVLAPDELLLELDGAMAHYRKAVGAGYVFVLAFNAGQALTSLQQGRPADNFDLPGENEPPRPADLVMNERLRANPIPYADLLKMHVIASVMQTSPMPLLWPYPDGYRSALLLSHETGAMDDRVFRMAEHEKDLDARTTWLVTASLISKESLETWKNNQFDMGVSFMRPPVGRVYKKYGPSFFQPVAVEASLSMQRKTVAGRLGGTLSTCKYAASQWTRDYTLAFRRLAAAQCQIDLSYAPVDPKQYGYLFGSGFPFLPVERNGMPMPTYEFPVVINDEAGLESIPHDAALQLLRESDSVYHEPVVAHFNADTMRLHPSYQSPATWQSLLNYASTNHIWMTSVKAFMYHYTLRKQAHMHYAFHVQTRVLDVKTSLPQADFNYTVALPRRTAYGALHAVWLDKMALDLTALKSTGDGLLLLLPVSSGDHLVQVQYN